MPTSKQTKTEQVKVPADVAVFIHRYCGRKLDLRDILEIMAFFECLSFDGFLVDDAEIRNLVSVYLTQDSVLRNKVITLENSEIKRPVPFSYADWVGRS
jgi:hypothetical protein